MFDRRYRIWLIKYLAGIFLPPIALLFVCLKALKAIHKEDIPRLILIALYVVFPIIYWNVTGWITEWQDGINARKLGVKSIPLIKGKRFGNMDLVARYTKGITEGYPGEIINELLDEAGVDTARLCLFGVDRVITRDHDVVKFILSTGFNEFEIGDAVATRLESFFGKGIFVADGEAAKMHRAMARPYFARDRISDYTTFHKHCETILDILRKNVSANEPTDVQDLFMTFSFDTAIEFLFGPPTLNPSISDSPTQSVPTSLGAKFENVANATTFLKAFEQGKANSQMRLGKPQLFWAAEQFFNDPQAEVSKSVSEYLEPLVRAAIARKECRIASGKEDGPEKLFVDHLVNSTSATSPTAMARARDEVLLHYGRTDIPTYDNLKHLKYNPNFASSTVRAVLNESLRLFPIAPVNSRQSKGRTVIPTRGDPLYVPRQWQFLYSAISIQKRKDLWGEDADEFNPSRWVDGREKEMASDPFRFIPFNAGPRICLGQQFAYNEASFVLVRLLQQFESFTLVQAEAAPKSSLPPKEWKSGSGRQAMELITPVMSMTLFAKGGVWLQMELATD
ncbi:hypothetical protein FRB96_009231 [Tulasnella sp. 330]|nr:hypothetical protein FRB96_009231 [Tulasnella sp. 330]